MAYAHNTLSEIAKSGVISEGTQQRHMKRRADRNNCELIDRKDEPLTFTGDNFAKSGAIRLNIFR